MDNYIIKLIKDVYFDCMVYNIPVEKYENIFFDRKKMASLGRCTKYSVVFNYTYNITLSNKLLASNNERAIKNTIMHELIHTCKDCMCHTGAWKRFANIANTLGKEKYNITRTTDPRAVFTENQMEQFYTKIYCTKCGQEVNIKKGSKYLKQLDWITHKHCGGKFSLTPPTNI